MKHVLVKSILVRSIASILIGGFLVLKPEDVSSIIIFVIGCLFLGPGIYSLVTYWQQQKKQEEGFKPTFPLVGLGSTLLGLFMVLLPGVVKTFIMYPLGALLILASLNQMAAVINSRKVAPLPFLFYAMPVALFLAGLFVLVKPMDSLSLPIIIVGIAMVVYGVVELTHYYWLQARIKELNLDNPNSTAIQKINKDDIEDAEIVE